MKLALIAPTKMLKYTRTGDMHFVLAQKVFHDAKYADFYAGENKFKLMDNGAYENTSLSPDRIIEAANFVRADEIVAPDIPSDPDKSFKITVNFLNHSPDGFDIMAVPHGRIVDEYVWHFRQLYNHPKVNTIGMSCLDLLKFEGKQRLRPMMVHLLNNKFSVDWDRVHLLGLDEPMELACYKRLGIRSVDTSMAFTHAHHRWTISLIPKKMSRVPDDAEIIDEMQHNLLLNNIRILKKYCREVS